MASFADLTNQSNEAQIERDKQRLSILESEYKEGGETDKSLAGDIAKLKSTGGGYGSFPKEAGIDINLKPIDYNKVVSKTTKKETIPYEEMSHSELQVLRMKNKEDKELNIKLAPYEHRAYAREVVAENPELAPLFASLLIPGYQVAKAVGLDVSATEDPTTPVSMEQLKQGYVGVGEGLARFASKELLELMGVKITK